MNTNLSPVLDILYEAEKNRKEGCRRVCELLSPVPPSTIEYILVGKDNELSHQSFITLLEEVSQIVVKHKVQRNITDWPFENFWNNPPEPRHSKLLGYFISPDQEHECWSFLLPSFLRTLNIINSKLPVDDECEVTCEDAHIDLLITRKGADGTKYAIIIENKVNWARNQDKQLQRYAQSVKERGFEYSEIYVAYLPPTNAKDPDPSDRAWIETKCGKDHYKKITFAEDILGWLDFVINDWSPTMDDGMCENLSHYRNLIRYLINQQKEFRMNQDILNKIEQAGKANSLPTWSQVLSLTKSAGELKECLESVLRGELILELQRILQRQGKVVRLCLENEPLVEIDVGYSPYDVRFGEPVNLCIPADAAVSVCFGCSGGGFWIGYIRSGSPDRQKTIEQSILSEAQERINSTSAQGEEELYYAWVWRKEITYDNCVATASTTAKTLINIHEGLLDRLKADGIKP